MTTLALLEARLNDLWGRDLATSALQREIVTENGEVRFTRHHIYLPLVIRHN